jgi:two-component system sensor histidine kinase PilS (NtrC family)
MDQLRQEMRKQDRLAVVGELAAGLAHEIRNPVAVIRGAVEELQNGQAQDETQRKLQSMALRESDHLNDIVGGFLDFAREPEMKREIFDVRDLALEVRELVDLEYNKADGYATRLECPIEPCWVSADVSQLKQVLVNLARNAMEAMKPNSGGTLRIMLSRQGLGPIELRFDDEGPGVPPDEMARIFEPFYTTKESGVGMGLAVCARIITAHDGTIRASSREGGGCSMIVHLPAAQPEEK